MPSSDREPVWLLTLAQAFETWLRRLVRRPQHAERESGDTSRAAAVDNAQSRPPATDGEMPAGPPAHWLERTRSPGPPAHWLELIEKAKAGASDSSAFEYGVPSSSEANGPPSVSSEAREEGAALDNARSAERQAMSSSATRMHPALKAQIDTRVEYKEQLTSTQVATQSSKTGLQTPGRWETKAEEQVSAKIYQPRRTEPKKPGAQVTAPPSRESTMPVVIKAGRTPVRSDVQPEQASSREQSARSAQSILANARNQAAGPVQPESIMRDEMVDAQASRTASLPPLTKTRHERASREMQAQVSVPMQTLPVPIAPRLETGQSDLPRELAQTLGEGRFSMRPAADTLRKRDTLTWQIRANEETPNLAYWPELPDEEAPDMADDMTETLRIRQHLQKLDAEQRGVEWSA